MTNNQAGTQTSENQMPHNKTRFTEDWLSRAEAGDKIAMATLYAACPYHPPGLKDSAIARVEVLRKGQQIMARFEFHRPGLSWVQSCVDADKLGRAKYLLVRAYSKGVSAMLYGNDIRGAGISLPPPSPMVLALIGWGISILLVDAIFIASHFHGL